MIDRRSLFETGTRGLLVLVLAAAAVACGTDDSPLQPTEPLPLVSLTTLPNESPTRMTVALSNFGQGRFSYGGCSLYITREEGTSWVRLPESPVTGCVAMAYGLGAGAVHYFSLPRPTADGVYRVEFTVRHSDSERDFTLVSRQFAVGIIFANESAARR